MLVAEWAGPGLMTYFLNGQAEPDAEQLAMLAARKVKIEREGVTHVGGDAPLAEVHLRDGRVIATDGIFLGPRTVMKHAFAEQLGLELESGPLGPFYRTDPLRKETSVPGVFACGDVAQPGAAVALAIGDGMRAGIGAHASLVFRP